MIVFDTTALSFLFMPGYKRSTPIQHGKERLEELRNAIENSQDKIGIPSPALSEFLVACDERTTDEFLKMVRSSKYLEICDFDAAAAVEAAIRTRKAIESGDKKEGLTAENAKIKFDRQIVAIAIVCNASRIISDDKDVKALGDRWGIKVETVEDLPIPPHMVPPPIIAIAMAADEKAAAERHPATEANQSTTTGAPIEEQPPRSNGETNGT